MPETQPASLPPGLTFEQALSRLEEIVRQLEDQDVSLEAALEAHAEGTALARYCMERLSAAELRVQELTLE